MVPWAERHLDRAAWEGRAQAPARAWAVPAIQGTAAPEEKPQRVVRRPAAERPQVGLPLPAAVTASERAVWAPAVRAVAAPAASGPVAAAARAAARRSIFR